jgi:hypothetical protein
MFLLRLIRAVVRGLFAKKADLSVPVPHGSEGELVGEEEARSKQGIFGRIELWGLEADDLVPTSDSR